MDQNKINSPVEVSEISTSNEEVSLGETSTQEEVSTREKPPPECKSILEIKELCSNLPELDFELLEKNCKVVSRYSVAEQYKQLALLCQNKAFVHPDWLLLAGQIKMKYIKQTAPSKFSESTNALRPILKEDYFNFVMKYSERLDAMVREEKDMKFNIFAVETLLKSYLARIKKDGGTTILETPQYMYMRVATYLWFSNEERLHLSDNPSEENFPFQENSCPKETFLQIEKMYKDLSDGKYSMSSPTMFNSGLFRPQLASCFVAGTKVYTLNRGPLPIEDVNIGDSVTTHLGNIKKVSQLHKNPLDNRQLYRIKVSQTPTVDVTGNHRFWAVKKGDIYHPMWISIDQLQPGDYISKPSQGLVPNSYINGTPEYVFRNTESSTKIRNEQCFALLQTKTEINENKPEFVYTLGVEDDHSYCVEGLVAENCFLYNVGDSMQSISKGWHDAAIISMNSGGLGIDFTSLRHSEIGQHGQTNGIVPWIKIMNQILVTVDQGSKRKGSGTAYLCCWHLDIEEFLDLRKASGPEDMRARDMFYALWVSDEFMRRVEKDQDWTLFCPNKVPKLDDKWGLDFEIAYRGFEKKVKTGKITHYRTVKARELWKKIILTQIETGIPFILYKDAVNRKSNQKNLGTHRSSNLCCEVTLHTDKNNIASCNLGSIALNSCVKSREGNDGVSSSYYDFQELEYLTREMVRNINQMIDRNYYPSEVPQIKYTNLRNRPLGVGVQGLSDTFAMLDLPWVSPEAKKLNEMIFETMYYAAVSESIQMAKESGPYETFQGSPASEGLLQFDLWDLEKLEKEFEGKPHNKPFISSEFLNKHITKRRGPVTDRYKWEELRQELMKHGMRNSMLMALMPTASSASILGNHEAFEPHTQHIYARTVLSGQFVIINEHLVADLQKIDMWTTNTVRNIMKNKGSISNLSEEGLDGEPLPSDILKRLQFLKIKYLTVFEIPQKVLLDMSLDRGRYICQTQSFNCWMKDPTFSRLNKFHFFGWSKGIKTGCYYLRQTAKTDPINFSLDSINIPTKKQKQKKKIVCNEEVCISCSS